jgi:hypothetical protein
MKSWQDIPRKLAYAGTAASMAASAIDGTHKQINIQRQRPS